MTTPATPASPNPAGDDRNLVAVDATYAAMSFEDKLHLFWKNNGTAVLVLCSLVLLGIVGKGGWDYLAAQKEAGIENDYAAATTPEQLKAFIATHAGHTLAGVAQLHLADDAYAAGKAGDALAAYDQVVATLKTGPLAARAQLGRAMAEIQSGKSADGAADLKLLANDPSQFKGLRVEAAYQLASLAAGNGNAADVQKYSDQLMQIDPASPWTQRAMALRASLPAPTAGAVPASGTPAAGVQIKLPGK